MVLSYGLMDYCSYRCCCIFPIGYWKTLTKYAVTEEVCSHRSVCLCYTFCNVKFRACFKKDMFNAKQSLAQDVPLRTIIGTRHTYYCKVTFCSYFCTCFIKWKIAFHSSIGRRDIGASSLIMSGTESTHPHLVLFP